LALALAVLHALFGRHDWAHFSGLFYLGVTAFFVLLVWTAASGRLARVFTWPPLTALGRWSYSLYLLHCTIANLCVLAVLALGMPRLWSIAAALPLSLAAAALSRRYVELPAQAWIKQKLRPKRAPLRRDIEQAPREAAIS
jgi:peptidoglycan/LPS O-acetylase OafA/YrhL